MIETIPDEISYVKIGNITMSHTSDYEAADYCVRQFDQAVTPVAVSSLLGLRMLP